MTDPTAPRPVTPDPRTTRVTALSLAARLHQGDRSSPYRLIEDTEVIAEYLRTGVVPEDPMVSQLRSKFSEVQSAFWANGAIISPGSPEPSRRWHRWSRRADS